jgi:hypothetical protein
MENFYYACLYDVLQTPEHRTTRREKVNRLKAQLIKLYRERERAAAGMIDMQSLESFQEERIFLFCIIKRQTRREKRTISQVTDLNGRTHVIDSNNRDLRCTLRAEIPTNTGGRSMCQEHGGRRSSTSVGGLESYIRRTANDRRTATCSGKSREKKAPGRDEISSGFFQINWEVMKEDLLKLFSAMFFDRKLTAQQKRGVIVLILKTTNPVSPADYRPITLLNNDYKIMALIIASRLQPVLVDLLHPSQYCDVPGRTIFDTVATVRDAIAHAERANVPLLRDLPGFQRSLRQDITLIPILYTAKLWF